MNEIGGEAPVSSEPQPGESSPLAAQDVRQAEVSAVDEFLMNEVLDSLIDNVAVIARDGTILAVNNAWREFARCNGAPPEVIDGVGLNHLGTSLLAEADDQSVLAAGIERVLSGLAVTFEFDYPCGTPSQERWFRMAVTPMLNTDTRFVVVHRDITRQVEEERERSKAESALSQAARLESVERIAGGVAHEFNNMLGVILGHAEHALDGDVSRADRLDDVVQIQRAAQRSALLVRHLLTFARRQAVAPSLIDVNEVVASQLETLRRDTGPEVAVTFTPSDDPCEVRMDPAQLELVLRNLCANSSEALLEGGWIHIVTVRESDAEAEIPGSTQHVRLTVTDNGPGFDPEHVPVVFDPFFTTKAPTEHAGLGLSTVHGAVSQIGGFVEIDSERSLGARVDVWLPCVEVLAADIPDVAIPTSAGRTVLIVDDEELMLGMTSRILRKAGWRVLTAESAEAALETALDPATKLDLLLTDVLLPGMDGPALVKAIDQAGRNVPHLFMSGYVSPRRGNAGLDRRRFIAKPFTATALLDKVEKVLVDQVSTN